MKGLSFAIGAVLVTAVFFITGLLSSNPLPLFVGFCGWTPAVFFVGWAARNVLTGKRLRWESVEQPPQAAPVQNRLSRLQQITKEKTV